MSNTSRRRALPIAVALTISTATLVLFIREAPAQEATKPAPVATEAPAAATTPPPPPAATTAPAPASASGQAKPGNPELPEVKIIQEKPAAKPVEEAAPEPKKKPAPVVEDYQPAPVAKPKKKVAASKPKATPAAKPQTMPDAPADEQPATVALEGSAALPEGVALAPDVMTAVEQTTAGPVVGYQALTTTTSTKTSAPLSKTPASITAVNKNRIEDQKITRLDEVYQSVPGVQPVFNGGEYEIYIIRGFASGERYRNGISIPVGRFDFANVERVEVLKGPASLFAGRMEPGGVINVVTTRPLDVFRTSVEVQAGSFDSYRTVFSMTGPANAEKTMLYRFDGAYTDTGSFQDRVYEDRIFLAPSVTLRPQSGTEINIAFEYSDRDFAGRIGHPAINGRIADVPRGLNYAQPGAFNQDHIDSKLIDANVSHRISEAMTVKAGIVATWNDYEFRDTPNAYVQFLLPDLLRRGLYFEDFERDSQSYYADLITKFQTGNHIRHELLTGIDHYKEEGSNQGFFGLNALFSPHTPPPCHPGGNYFTTVDPFKPVVNDPSLDFDCIDGLRRNQPNDFAKYKVSWTGLYVQDQITVAEQLHLFLGGRYDWGRSGSGSIAGEGHTLDEVTLDTVENEKFTPRAGALYDLLPWLGVYASYSESVSIDGARGPDNSPLPPEEGKQYEGGVKMTLLGGGLLVTASVYEITKSNVRAPNPADDGASSIAVGEVRSRGFELEGTGRIDDHWSVNAFYAYTDAIISKDTSIGGTEGNRVSNVPLNSGGVWLKYDFESGGRTGLSIGAGVWAFGEREGDLFGTYTLDAYTRADALISYKMLTGYGLMTAQLNVYNIFDELYYLAGPSNNTGPAHNLAGDPRTFRASLKFDF